MKEYGLVSVVTSNYNCEKYIAQTIESVQAQTYANWEMLIIDDCSTDRSYEIAKEYASHDDRIKVHRMSKKSGAALCRNRAIELAQGQYLAFLDSDDLWKPEKLAHQLQFMQDNDCDFSFAKYEHIDENGQPLGKVSKVVKRVSYKKMLFHCFTGCLTVVYENKKIFGPNIKSNNDYGLFLQVLKQTRNAMGFDELCGSYRIRKKSVSRNKMRKVKPLYQLLVKEEKISPIFFPFLLFTNVFYKTFFKYTRE